MDPGGGGGGGGGAEAGLGEPEEKKILYPTIQMDFIRLFKIYSPETSN